MKLRRRRFASRIAVVDALECVLLMNYVHPEGALARKNFWSLPGGEVESGENFQAAARRELFEETGIVRDDLGPEIAVREFDFQMYDGEHVLAEEHFFRIVVDSRELSHDHLTAVERQIVTEFRWWPMKELRTTNELMFPKDLALILA